MKIILRQDFMDVLRVGIRSGEQSDFCFNLAVDKKVLFKVMTASGQHVALLMCCMV